MKNPVYTLDRRHPAVIASVLLIMAGLFFLSCGLTPTKK